MKNIFFTILFTLLLTGFYSCNKNQNSKEVSEEKTVDENNSAYEKNDEEASETEKEGKVKSPEHSERETESDNKYSTKSIVVKFPVGSTQITMDGNINGFGEKISYEFEVSKGQTLNAVVKPKEGEGNIRINQIISPDGKADGPFSDKLTYKLTEAGKWKLILGEDMMAGEPWKGTYLLTIEIK